MAADARCVRPCATRHGDFLSFLCSKQLAEMTLLDAVTGFEELNVSSSCCLLRIHVSRFLRVSSKLKGPRMQLQDKI